MSSSISSSDPWRRFAGAFLATALATLAVLYGFVVLVDPWDVLPLSPPLPRVPISGNARFSFPALAASPRFDSAIFGTSTSRLLQPAQLDPAFAARFVNLSMNSATAWEQTRLLGVFLRARQAPHAGASAAPVAIIIGLDAAWCGPVAERTTPRPFPEWMYQGSPWRGYREMLTPYAVQEAANQFAVMARLKRRRYGLDGYTNFVPDDAAYDPARVEAAFARRGPPDLGQAVPAAIPLPAMGLLPAALEAIPRSTRVVLYFPPIEAIEHGGPGSGTAARWAACKAAAVAMAAPRGAQVLDFMFPSGLTSTRANYWDPLHYRLPVAARIAAALARPGGDDVRVLSPPGVAAP